MSQYDKDVPADKSRNDMEPLPDNFFWRWLISMGTAPAGLFGVHMPGVMPQTLPEAPVPHENVSTNPFEKFLKALKTFWEKRSSAKNEVRNGSLQAISTSAEPNSNDPTDPDQNRKAVLMAPKKPLPVMVAWVGVPSQTLAKASEPSTNDPTDPDQNRKSLT